MRLVNLILKIKLFMKIYLNKINEDWIIDRLSVDFKNKFKKNTTNFLIRCDVIWIIAPWTWKKIPTRFLKSKKVLCSYYHFDFSSFDYEDFKNLDQYVDEYHVISQKTKQDLSSLTDKKITSIPFWVDENIFFDIKDKETLRNKYGFNKEDFLVGSFQRDTEGSDLKSPKLIKGPDRFFEISKSLLAENKNLKIILAGKRRQFLIHKFIKDKIPYKLYEMVDLRTLNELYNLLDLYIVTSRIEGGPQAIIECGLSKTPIISTDVGVAKEILNSTSIFDGINFKEATPDINYAYQNSIKYTKQNGLPQFFLMFEKFYN